MAVWVWIPCLLLNVAADGPPALHARAEPGKVIVLSGQQPVATYAYHDQQVLRPYLCDVFTTDGHRITRRLPPVEGQDATDHPTMHPGVWLAFGDLAGNDFWRNKGRVVHERFLVEPRTQAGEVTWSVVNRFEAGDKTVCREACRIAFVPRAHGYLILWDSEFSSADSEFTFGDQEEMGLGLRVGTPLAVKSGGEIVSSAGGKNEREVWGRTADWCDYRGRLGDRLVGAMLMPDPANFRPSWFHARDYGLLVANAFGRRAFKQGEASRVTVAPGDKLRLRYGIYIHSTPADAPPDLAAEHRAFVAREAER